LEFFFRHIFDIVEIILVWRRIWVLHLFGKVEWRLKAFFCGAVGRIKREDRGNSLIVLIIWSEGKSIGNKESVYFIYEIP